MKNKDNIFLWLLFGLLLLPSLWGLLHSGFFVSDDGHWMVIRLSAFYQAFVSGQIPTRFLPQLNNGYGYPVADFLYPLFLYLGSLMHLFKIPLVSTIKILFGLSLLFSAIGAFFWLRKIFQKSAAFVGALVYLYFPYHLFDIYTRGSMGELVSLAILPFVFLFIENANSLGISIGIGLLITAHNTLALLFLPIIFIYLLLKKTPWKLIAGEFAVGLGLSAFFWLPALFDKQFTVFGNTLVSDPSHYFLTVRTYSLVGWVSVVVFLSVFFVKKFWQNKLVLFFWLVGIVGIFMATNASQFLWRNNFLQQFVQFPFRFLSLTIPGAAFVAACTMHAFRKNLMLSILLIALLGFSTFSYIFPKTYDMSPDSFYATNMDTTTVQNEYMPVWVQKRLPYDTEKIHIADKNGQVTIFKEKGTFMSAQVISPHATTVQVGFIYFPGWNIWVDGKKIAIHPSERTGLLSFSMPSGSHRVQVFFGETPIRLFADAISIVSILLILLYNFFLKKKYEK